MKNGPIQRIQRGCERNVGASAALYMTWRVLMTSTAVITAHSEAGSGEGDHRELGGAGEDERCGQPRHPLRHGRLRGGEADDEAERHRRDGERNDVGERLAVDEPRARVAVRRRGHEATLAMR